MVKFAVFLLLAAAVAAPAFAHVSSSDRFATRDVAAQDLFGRAAIDVINDMFTREEINEIFGRDVSQLNTRDLEELYEREIDINHEMSARDLEDLEARSWFKNPFSKKKAPTEQPGQPSVPMSPSTPTANAVRRNLLDTANVEMSARDLEYLEARSSAIIQGFVNTLASAVGKPSTGDAAAAAAPPPADAPAERAFYDSDLFERELLKEPIKRSYEEELLARYLEDGELYERSYGDADVFEREYDEDMFARDFDFDELD